MKESFRACQKLWSALNIYKAAIKFSTGLLSPFPLIRRAEIRRGVSRPTLNSDRPSVLRAAFASGCDGSAAKSPLTHFSPHMLLRYWTTSQEFSPAFRHCSSQANIPLPPGRISATLKHCRLMGTARTDERMNEWMIKWMSISPLKQRVYSTFHDSDEKNKHIS